MKKLTLILLLFLFSCNESQKPKVTSITDSKSPQKINIDPIPKLNIKNHLKNYKNLKQNIYKKRNQLKSRTDISQKEKFDLAQQSISNYLIDSIFHYWEGTRWDFNGHTKEPKIGEIACGYYITTTLQDLGIKLNRIKLAQQASAVMITQLCEANSIKKFTTMEKLNQYLKPVPENEVLIVGLEFHVGFMFKRNNKNYFAHSNYIGNKGVMIEIANQSNALKSSNFYMIGNLSKNKRIINNWINNL